MMSARGHFAEVSATADIDPDHPETSSVEVTISAASIPTHNETRDDDLRSSNFLEVEKFPTITFKARASKFLTQSTTASRGTSPSRIVLDPWHSEVTKYGEFNDLMMGHRIAYGARTQINRKDFGLTFNMVLQGNMVLDGRFVVSDEIQIMIEGELVEQKEPAQVSSS
jgi:polyisoprenoid-binding protein YceI